VVHTYLKCEKDNLHAGYQRLSEKHKALNEKAKQENEKLVEAQAVELTNLCGDLDLETYGYTKYHQTVRRRLHKLHEMVASSFDEVKAQCLPFPGKGEKVEEMIDWVTGEVKAVLDTVWWLNDNFVIIGIEGVLNMLNGGRCQELGRLHDLATCHGTSALEDVPDGLHKLVRQIVQRWWKPYDLPEDLHRLEVAHATTVNNSDN
jgi:hypothetical protein